MKFTETTFTNRKEILKFAQPFTAIPVMVSDAGIIADADGKKIVSAGTIVGGGVLLNPDAMVTEKNDAVSGAEAEGVLLWDVDVTHGAAPGSMVVFGFIDLNKLPKAPDASVDLKLVMFLK